MTARLLTKPLGSLYLCVSEPVVRASRSTHGPDGGARSTSHGGDGFAVVEERRPTVLYLAGSGRSGSTLLERMLGEIHGFVNVGELIDLFRRVHSGDELCGCGERFSECTFWCAVGERAFGGWSQGLIAEMADLQATVARQRFIPRHLAPRQGASFSAAVQSYADRYSQLYQVIAEVAGAEIVVDASKWPAQAMALAGGSIDLRVIHVVRDVRGVAWSMSKRDLVRPQATQGLEVMFSRGMVTTAAEWTLCQAEVDALRLKGVPVSVMTYEGMIQDARSQVRRVLHELDLCVSDQALSHLGERAVLLGPSHGLSGNPSRFAGGITPLRKDEQWRAQLPRHRQIMLGMFGLPQRFRRQAESAECKRGERGCDVG
ncbi:sulfotransferase [Ornithinimicrobium murale]|uniref:sulfotransferase n=1 Tax=Ornithinimicrobium murale TaxID=1050153 RepID=UPI000E0D2E79|nr:sulfotransferase [Ornithinimicrobium murale]